jgi:hypothetical protein
MSLIFNSLLSQLENSIIRRAIIFLFLVFFGFLFNYLLYFVAGKLLQKESFGIFYGSITLINITTAPSMILGMYFSRYLSQSLLANGIDSAIFGFRKYFGLVMKWGLLGSIISMLLIFPLKALTGIESSFLILILILAIYAAYITEAIRTGIEFQKKVIIAGVFTFIWCFTRAVFGISGLILFSTAWSGMVGIALSSIPVCFIFYLYLTSGHNHSVVSVSELNLDIPKLILFTISFGLTALIMYLDIIIAYFLLVPAEFTTYSASSILPKSIIVFTMPLMKVLYPIIVSDSASIQSHQSAIKAIIVILCVVLTGTAVLFTQNDFFSSSQIAIKFSDPKLLQVMAITVIPLTMIRSLVSFELAKDNDRYPLMLLIPAIIYLGYVVMFKPNIVEFSFSFLVFSFLTFFFCMFLMIMSLKQNLFNLLHELIHR